MKQISPSKIYINFECVDCNTSEKKSISDAVSNGAPCCPQCKEEMDMVDCELDTTD